MISSVLAVSAMLLASGSDVVIGLAVGIPVVVIGGGTLVAPASAWSCGQVGGAAGRGGFRRAY